MAREGTGTAQQEPGEEHQGGGGGDHAAQGQTESTASQTETER